MNHPPVYTIFAILALTLSSPASAGDVDASAGYSTESPGGFTETGKERVVINFYNEQGTTDCTGNGCGNTNLPEPGTPSPGQSPGVEPQAALPVLHVITSPLAGGLQTAINNAVSGAFGVNNSNPSDAAAGRASHIDNWVGHEMPKFEASLLQNMEQIWAKGYFFSQSQQNKSTSDLSRLDSAISSKRFNLEDLTHIIIHAPGTHDMVRTAVATQLQDIIKVYDEMSSFCRGGDFCDWKFDKVGYIERYSKIAEGAEEIDFELYIVAVESGVDSAERTLTETYKQAQHDIESSDNASPLSPDVTPREQIARRNPSAQRRQASTISHLRDAYQRTSATTSTKAELKRVGLSALSAASEANKSEMFSDADFYIGVARDLLSAVSAIVPGIGISRDIYESVTGKDAFSGFDITNTERFLAVLGVLSAGAIDEPRAIFRTLRRIADHKEFFLDKSLNKVRSFKTETVNKFLEQKYNYTEPPYRTGSMVYRYETTEAEQYIRFYTPGQSRKDGAWILRPGDVEGLPMEEIARKFGFPDGRTNWVEVRAIQF